MTITMITIRIRIRMTMTTRWKQKTRNIGALSNTLLELTHQRAIDIQVKLDGQTNRQRDGTQTSLSEISLIWLNQILSKFNLTTTMTTRQFSMTTLVLSFSVLNLKGTFVVVVFLLVLRIPSFWLVYSQFCCCCYSKYEFSICMQDMAGKG